jgi:hypothetical protein
MTAPDAKFIKSALKVIGINVKRAFIYRGYMILTVAECDASECEQSLNELNILQRLSPLDAPKTAKANILGYGDAAEFTGLVQL